MSAIKEVVFSQTTGDIWVEKDNDTSYNFNLNNITVATVDDVTGAVTFQSDGTTLLDFSSVENTSTVLAATLDEIPISSKSIMSVRPATNSNNVYVGKWGGVSHYGPGDIINAGHLVGVFGITDNKTAGVTLDAAYGVEGRIQATAGTQTFTASFTAAVQGQTEGAGGTVGIHADYNSPLLADHSHITVKYSLLNMDPNKRIKTQGVIETQGGDVIPRNRVGVVTGRYYPIEGVNALYAAVSTSRDVIWASPIVVPSRATYNRIGFTLGTGVDSCTARLGIYKDNNGVPGDLVVDAGTITVGSGDAGTREITMSQELFSGVYWACIQVEGGASDPAITWAGVNGYNLMGMSNTTSNDTVNTIANTGALPSSFGSGAFTGGGFSPFLWLRSV